MMNASQELDSSIAYWSFGWLPSDRLPEVAEKALAEGYDSVGLVRVACSEHSPDPSLHVLFEQALNEIGKSRLGKIEAGRYIARDVAYQIVAGKIGPTDGAREIWRITLECEEVGAEFGIFGGRVTECEDLPAHREHIDRLIIEDARTVIDQRNPQ